MAGYAMNSRGIRVMLGDHPWTLPANTVNSMSFGQEVSLQLYRLSIPVKLGVADAV